MNQTVEVEGVIVERNWPLYINIYAVMSQFNINACKPIASIPVFSEKEKKVCLYVQKVGIVFSVRL